MNNDIEIIDQEGNTNQTLLSDEQRKMQFEFGKLMCNDNHPLTDEEKKDVIAKAAVHYGDFMTALGFDWRNDDNAKDTPQRVAKSFVNDLLAGVYSKDPRVVAFENNHQSYGSYEGMVFQGNIEVKSVCAHHHLPFVGTAHVAYIPGKDGKVIGLSKLNRTVVHFARRPQIQEALTNQIHHFLNETIEDNQGIAVMIIADHQCACLRGVQHDSTMITNKLTGFFFDDDKARSEFLKCVEFVKK